MSTLGTNYTTPRWIGKPLTHITPMSLSDGATFERKLDWVYNYLVNTLVPELDGILDQWFDQYKDDHAALLASIQATKDEWESLFNQFMADVVAQLEALNDQAVANLVNSQISKTREALDVLYEPRFRSDTNRVFVSHDLFNITGVGNEYTKIVNALATIPAGSTLTIPDDFTIDIGGNTLVIDRPVGYKGGRIKSTQDKVITMKSSNSSLENVKITGNGVRKGYLARKETVGVVGMIDNYIENVTIKNVHVNDIRDTGFHTEFVKNFLIEDCSVIEYGYSGIGIRSTDDFVVRGNYISDLVTIDGLHDRFGYGISVSDQVAMEPYRSRNGVVESNIVKYVRRGAGCETHGGYNIAFLKNEVYGCRNSFTLTTGNQDRPFTAERCRIIGNFVDATGYDTATLSNGVSLGGGAAENPVVSDCIVVLNTFMNTTRPVSYPPAYRPEPFMGMSQSVVAMNTANNMRTDEMESTNWTTGWIPAETFGSFRSGYQSNSQIPLKMRVTHDDLGYHVEINGVAALASPPATGFVFFNITNSKLRPPEKLMLGMSTTVDASGLFMLSVEPNGDILHQFSEQSTAPLNYNSVIYGKWSTRVGRWDGGQIN